MRTRREPDGSLEITESPTVLRAALLVGAIAIPWAVIMGPPAGGSLLAEARTFRFDRTHQQLHWRRSRLVGSHSGTLPFSAMPLSNTSSLRAEDYAEILTLVRATIGQADADGVSDAVELVRAGRIVDATIMIRRQPGVSLEEATRRVRQIQQDLTQKEP